MKKILLFLCLCGSVFLTACQQEPVGLSPGKDGNTSPKTRSVEPDGMIVLGSKLQNPYSVANMQNAFNNLKRMRSPELSELPDLEVCFATSHAYVRLHPKTQEELAALKADSTLILYDYPLDCEILEGGSYYHDPSIPDSLPTYQYASINVREFGKLYDLGVEYEILENLFIPDEEADDSTDGVTLPSGQTMSESLVATLVETSFAMTGNLESEETEVATPITRAGKWRPAGRITAYDDVVGGAVPLKKVRVRARRWFTTHIGYTDANGYFSCNGRFKRPANYSIVWESDRWDIRDGNIVQAYYNGPKRTGSWNLYISGGKSLRFSALHRAAYRSYFIPGSGLSIPVNSRKEKIAYINDTGGKNGDYNQQWGMGIWSDIRIFGKNSSGWREMSAIFTTTCHELGHATHYTHNRNTFGKSDSNIRESWARCVQYIQTNREYKDLGVFSKLNRTESITFTENGVKKTEIWMQPDQLYNFQYWPQNEYTPLFIDLIDNYNQRTYYKRKGFAEIDYNKQSNDNIHDMPITEIERIVFASKTFADVKQKLLDYARLNSNAKAWYNLTPETINNLFEVYEK